MDFLPDSVNKLIEELSKLPGIGQKSAQRLAFHVLKNSDKNNNEFGEAILKIKEGVFLCEICFALAQKEICKICSDPGRDSSILCVLENTMDMLAIEKTGEFRGLYHVLHGKISPLDGIGPEDIKMAEMFKRLTASASPIKEVILAMNPDLEGETTSLFIKKQLEAFRPLRVTRIARGVPSGGSLEYSDDMTLIRALQGRQSI